MKPIWIAVAIILLVFAAMGAAIYQTSPCQRMLGFSAAAWRGQIVVCSSVSETRIAALRGSGLEPAGGSLPYRQAAG
ncbi:MULTISPECIES: hypothetical protein [unclassified Devosia]|uniref:hypothetical protein n=1 Tax=unclassified Devosia TaxID=196773 RepID=UPI00155755DA|nr:MULTISPECIES: hypothetical protein [unclassified Devosia]